MLLARFLYATIHPCGTGVLMIVALELGVCTISHNGSEKGGEGVNMIISEIMENIEGIAAHQGINFISFISNFLIA